MKKEMTEQEAINIVNEELPRLKGYPRLKHAMRVIMNSVYGHGSVVRIGVDGANKAAVAFMRKKVEEAVRDVFCSNVEIKKETEN